MTTAFFDHWQLALIAASAGLTLGVVLVAVSYLVVPMRLRSAADPAKRARLLNRELARLRRLWDAAAFLEEHGNLEAGELRTEAELRTLVLLLAPGTRTRSRRGR